MNCYKVILLQWKELIMPVLWQNNTETKNEAERTDDDNSIEK